MVPHDVHNSPPPIHYDLQSTPIHGPPLHVVDRDYAYLVRQREREIQWHKTTTFTTSDTLRLSDCGTGEKQQPVDAEGLGLGLLL
ncbi:hypothetical protein GBAR_LOCUS5717 [Geodia barretti]|uniref:Uncharacterized protein n=1 Tax=Geodia barretti TaxID=519541 RepID=A0AA35RCY1_GEOBA|nr:hypothetical protein GBAR_LOCUS5717 [Geodia barretti]